MIKTDFTKRDTNVVKGFLMIMVLMHHLFYDTGTYENYTLIFCVLNPHQVVVFAQYFKFCIAAFSFLTYYGMTKKFMSISKDGYEKTSVLVIIKQYINLLFSFLFVYGLSVVAAVLLKVDFAETYSVAEKPWIGYAVIDALGMSNFFATPTLNITWWYMSFAIVILFLFPLLYKGYQRFSLFMITAIAILPGAFHMDQTYYGMCAFSMALGMAVAKLDLFARIKAYGQGKWYAKVMKAVICMALFFITYQMLFFGVSMPWYCAIASATWIYACYEFLSPIKGVSGILAFIGKNSLNIFLVHTFIYYYYARDFVYSFRISFIILLVLIICSVLTSVVIEAAKKLLRYQKLIGLVQKRAERVVNQIIP